MYNHTQITWKYVYMCEHADIPMHAHSEVVDIVHLRSVKTSYLWNIMWFTTNKRYTLFSLNEEIFILIWVNPYTTWNNTHQEWDYIVCQILLRWTKIIYHHYLIACLRNDAVVFGVLYVCCVRATKYRPMASVCWHHFNIVCLWKWYWYEMIFPFITQKIDEL